eukprot:Opistho-1_new@48020
MADKAGTKRFGLTIYGLGGSIMPSVGYKMPYGTTVTKGTVAPFDLGPSISKVMLCNPFYDDDLVVTGIVVRDLARQREFRFDGGCKLSLGGCIWGAVVLLGPILRRLHQPDGRGHGVDGRMNR